jgi:hypothetical protein
MRVDVHVDQRLPRQAGIIHLRDDRAQALVGTKVSIFDTGFFEGGWAQTPGPEALRSSGVHFGSGVVWGSDKLTVISPSHALEYVWVAATADEIWAANSLALLVSAARPERFHILRARNAIRSMFRGMKLFQRRIWEEGEVTMWRFANGFVDLQVGREPVERQQEQQADFRDYKSYVDHLINVIRELCATYGSEAISVYLSRGYDSPAVAVLAREVAPVTALCMRQTADGSADDGAEIAKALDMPVVVYERKRRETRVVDWGPKQFIHEVVTPEDYAAVFEFFSVVHIADEVLRVPDELVADRAVLSGWHGDSMWGLEGDVWRDLARPHSSSGGIGLGEFRLRTGFMHVPVPVIAFNRAEEVRRIGQSAEMAPWRLGTDYDRPVARRIVEEAGVPRGLFGVEKLFVAMKATNFHDIAGTLFSMQRDRYAPAIANWPFARALPTDVAA